MTRLRMILKLILLGAVVSLTATANAAGGTGHPLSFPAIASTSQVPPTKCVLHFDVITFEGAKGAMYETKTPFPPEALPASTRNFTEALIDKFLVNPARYADRFSEVKRENCSSTVGFFLTLSHPGNVHEVQELWYYTLTVGQKNGGKPFPIARLITSAAGEILYGNADKVSPYWSPGTITRSKDALSVDIVDYRDGERIDRFIYRLGDGSAESDDEWPKGSAQNTINTYTASLKAEDKRLNEVYKKLLSASYANIAHKEAREFLITAQRAWIKFRDANCAMDGELRGGVPAWKLAKSVMCSAGMTAQRRKELENLLEDCCE